MTNLPEIEVNDNADRRARAVWILRHQAELKRRYGVLNGLLHRAAAGEDIDPLDIELARADLMALLATAAPDSDEDGA